MFSHEIEKGFRQAVKIGRVQGTLEIVLKDLEYRHDDDTSEIEGFIKSCIEELASFYVEAPEAVVDQDETPF